MTDVANGSLPTASGRRPPPLAGEVKNSWLSLRFALRELRGGLRGFYVFIACIALGVMAIAGRNQLILLRSLVSRSFLGLSDTTKIFIFILIILANSKQK